MAYEMRERLARKLTETLRHHGVTLHPDDVDGLALDSLAALREPTEAMIQAACDATFGPDPLTPAKAHRIGWQAMIDAAAHDREDV